MTDLDQRNLQYLSRRSIIPLIPASAPLYERPAFKALRSLENQQRFSTETALGPQVEDLPDPNNVQGDIVYLFPKKAEHFVFFRIANVKDFKAALKTFRPSSSQDVINFLHEIGTAKRNAQGGRIGVISKALTQIAFSRMGMNYMGESEATGDARFDQYAMRDNKDYLGDQAQWDAVFDKPNPDPVNGSTKQDTGSVHGVFSIAGSDRDTCVSASQDVVALFKSSITVMQTLEGIARPGQLAGHEHFGYEDGISQPALRNLVVPRPGQMEVDPGVIICGYKGDPVVDDPNSTIKRPAWAKDGTMMVFRKLEQDVLGFDDYLATNGQRWREFSLNGAKDNLTDEEGAELWGARMIGRWKSGAPLQLCPVRDDPILAVDPARNNDFDYRIRDNPKVSPSALTNLYCPFTGHTRKTAPRNLDPYIQTRYLESGMIVRAGLPYGIEVTAEERRANESKEQRGLLFVAYQSSLEQGFVRQTISYANNDFFPTTSLRPFDSYHGQDPIIGGPPPQASASAPTEVEFTKQAESDKPRPLPKTGEQVNWRMKSNATGEDISVVGFANVTKQGAVDPPGVPQGFFVTSRGGEYFFVPSIKTLKTWATDGKSSQSALDIMFVLDASSSMQRYIDQARDRIDTICADIARSGNWDPSDIRVGLIAFRDHPQPDYQGNTVDYGFVSKSYGFRSDVGALRNDLAALKAEGGGDGPEAQCDALDDALNAPWKDEATKIVILVTDSPPHGIKEYGDKLPNGCPSQNDPCRTADLMADNGITLHVIACEPTLSGSYSKAHDFYVGITKKTGGTMVALSHESTLSNIIVGQVVESADIQRLAMQNRAFVLQQAMQNASFDTISKQVLSKVGGANVQLNKFEIEEIYQSNPAGDGNANVWFNAKRIDGHTNDQIQTVKGFRIKQEYRKNGSKAGKPQAMSLKKQSVTQEQADSIVRAALLAK